MLDLYEVLQVHPRAEPEVLRAAYRVLARKYHPDHGGDARRMITLTRNGERVGFGEQTRGDYFGILDEVLDKLAQGKARR